MKGKFYLVDYMPNKIVFVKEEDKNNCYAFFKERGSELKAVKHGITKGMKKDFKKFNPSQEIKSKLINLIITP